MDDDGLKVETAALREVSAALSAAATGLEAAPGRTEVSAAACAHDALRERLAEVGAGWDRRRQETVALVEGLGRTAHEAALVYEGVDLSLASLIEGRPR